MSAPPEARATEDATDPVADPKSRSKRNTQVGPRGTLELLSKYEVEALTSSARDDRLLDLFRRCALAVLNTGSDSDDAAAIFDAYSDFSIEVAGKKYARAAHTSSLPFFARCAILDFGGVQPRPGDRITVTVGSQARSVQAFATEDRKSVV